MLAFAHELHTRCIACAVAGKHRCVKAAGKPFGHPIDGKLSIRVAWPGTLSYSCAFVRTGSCHTELPI